MRIVVFGPDRRVGALFNGSVMDLNRADPSLPSTLQAFIEAGQSALDRAQRAIDQASRAPDGAVQPAASVKLAPPWPGRRVAMMGGNYGRHLAGLTWQQPGALEASCKRIRDTGIWGFFKVSLPVLGPEDPVPYPHRSGYVDYEGEAAVVIGKTTKDFKGARADDVIFGVTLLNDWSVRDDQYIQGYFNFNLQKNFDGSTTIGPAISVGERKYDDIPVVTKVNGQVRQDFNSSEMVFNFAEVIEWLSRDFTLLPGDIISGGTSVGTAADQTPRPTNGEAPAHALYLNRGDVVEVSSACIGTLRNTLV